MVIHKKYDKKTLEQFTSKIVEIPEFNDDYIFLNENTANWIQENFELYFNESHPDIVIVGGWPFFESIPVFKNFGMEVIFNDHGAVPLDGFSGGALEVQKKLRSQRKKYLKHSSLIISISKFILDTQSLVDTEGLVPIKVVPNGTDHIDNPVWLDEKILIDTSFGNARKIVNSLKNLGKKLILCLGRWELNGYKNSRELFNITRNIEKLHPGCILLILTENTQLQTPIDLKNLIVPLGFPDDMELKYIMSQVDLGLSVSLWEGFNLPIAEMQWLGRPVLAFDIGAHPEVILDPWYLCKNSSEMIEKSVKILNGQGIDPFKQIQLQKEYHDYFRWDRVINSYDEIISNLVTSDLKKKIIDLSIIIDVTNAVRDPANSGVIRVTRRICKELQSYMNPLFVVWDSSSQNYVLPFLSELKQLGEFNGPDIRAAIPVSPEGHRKGLDLIRETLSHSVWLLFTETLDESRGPMIRHFARSQNIKLGAIFYDAIPVFFPELCKDIKTKNNHDKYMRGLADCDVIIPISDYSSQCLLNYWNENQIEGCRIVSNLLPGEFGGSERLKTPSHSNNSVNEILCVSTLEPRKNHNNLIEAFLLLKEQYPMLNVKLTLVGNRYAGAFDIAEKIQSISDSNPDIKWVGVVDDLTLHQLYEQASFTVYPSIVEGFGMPILESLWHGKPCICYNEGVMAELAKNGGCLTTDVKDIQSLSDSIYRLITDKNLYFTLCQEAVTREIKTWDEYIEILLSILESESSNTFQDAVNLPHVKPKVHSNWEEILYPNCLCDNWQMNHSERLAMIAILSRHKPRCSIEIRTFKGGSLSLISQYSHSVFSIDIDPTIPDKFGYFNNVSFLTGDSSIILKLLFDELDREEIPVDFILIDGDHSAEGIKRDLETVLTYTPKKPLLIVMHDSFNPECRKGMLEVNWEKSPYVQWVDLDFIPGRIVETEGPSHGEMWGGLGLVYMSPQIRESNVQVNISANQMYKLIRGTLPL
ncbi:glycosyltransferase [Methanospirillum sp.]